MCNKKNKKQTKIPRSFAPSTVRLYKLSQKLWNIFIYFVQLNKEMNFSLCSDQKGIFAINLTALFEVQVMRVEDAQIIIPFAALFNKVTCGRYILKEVLELDK